MATVLGMQQEATAFGEKLVRVNYEFEADGRLHRDSDQVLPAIANRWQPGDREQVLHIAARGYDSVIISTA